MLIFAAEWGGPARQKKRYAPNLRDENLRNFNSKADKRQESKTASTHSAWGCAPFSFIGFSQDLHLGTGKGSPALLLWDEVKLTNK